MILTSEPMPRNYSVFVIQVTSEAYGLYVDYRVCDRRVQDPPAESLADLRAIHPKREFRLVRRTVSDEILPD